VSWQVEGYAARWNVAFAPEVPGLYSYAPQCFSFDPATIELWFMHKQERCLLKGEADGLQLWQDANGLAFRIASFAMTRPNLIGLAHGIGRGAYCGVSAHSQILKSTDRLNSAGRVTAMLSARVFEISIAPRGACPGTGAWFSRHAYDLSLIPHQAREACSAFQRQQALAPTPPLPFSWAAGSPSALA
jgi:hypothetical protein